MKLPQLRFLIVLAVFFLPMNLQAQPKQWTLQECIEYGLKNNPDLSQSVLNQRMAALQYRQSQLSQIPTLSTGLNYGRSFGRSVDPTSNQFIEANYDFSGANANLDVMLFGWFSKRKTIQANKLSLEAAKSNYEQLSDDISLNIATVYLRILLANEQIGIAENQLQFSSKQLEQTRAFVNVGRSPELDLVQMEVQQATDSAMYFSALNEYQNAVLQLKVLMNYAIEQPLEIKAPKLNDVSLSVLMEYQPEEIFEIAKENRYAIKTAELNAQAAEHEWQSARAMLWPQLFFGLQSGTNYSSMQKDITGIHLTGVESTGQFVDVNNQTYKVMQPTYEYGMATTPFFRQFGSNLRQTAVLSLSIPIFNGWQASSRVQQAKINLVSKQIETEKAVLKLKQDIYSAYYDAQTATQKFHSMQKAEQGARLALSYAERRYEQGLLSMVDLLTTQAKAYKASSDAAGAKFDLLFKLKILDYYLGNFLNIE